MKPFWQIHKELKALKIRKGTTFFCKKCQQKGCVPYGGVQGSLIFCEDCFYKRGCQREIEVLYNCCEAPKTKLKKVKRPKGCRFSARKRRQLKRSG